jgi:hypothetical protein
MPPSDINDSNDLYKPTDDDWVPSFQMTIIASAIVLIGFILT